ncbi:MAG: hypothetical protein HQK51_08260 [Oligoflexia bacterium]|nr:hypothetical protein [Oligoflexia bacterium]
MANNYFLYEVKVGAKEELIIPEFITQQRDSSGGFHNPPHLDAFLWSQQATLKMAYELVLTFLLARYWCGKLLCPPRSFFAMTFLIYQKKLLTLQSHE